IGEVPKLLRMSACPHVRQFRRHPPHHKSKNAAVSPIFSKGRTRPALLGYHSHSVEAQRFLAVLLGFSDSSVVTASILRIPSSQRPLPSLCTRRQFFLLPFRSLQTTSPRAN